MDQAPIITARPGIRATIALQEVRAVVKLSGVISAGSWVDVVAAVHQAIEQHGGILFVEFDLSRAVLAVSEREVPDLSSKLLATAIRTTCAQPTTLLVSEVCEPMVRRLAWDLALRGIEWATFSDAGACAAWAEQRLSFEVKRRAERAGRRVASPRCAPTTSRLPLSSAS